MQLKKNYSDCFGKEERKIFPQSVQKDKIKIHNTVSYKQTQKQERQQEGRKRKLNTQASFVFEARLQEIRHVTYHHRVSGHGPEGLSFSLPRTLAHQSAYVDPSVTPPPHPHLPCITPTHTSLVLSSLLHPTCPHPPLRVCVSKEYMSHPRRRLAPLRATDFQTGRLAASVDLVPCFQC